MANDSPLLAMPVEIQLAICSQLLENESEGDITSAHRNPDHNTWQSALDRFSTLGSLAFTCKDLQKAVAPLLYQSVMVSIEKPVAFIRLIRRFSRVPGDGHLVKELNILGGSGGPNLSSDQAAFLSREASHLGIRKQETGDSVKAASLLIDVLLCQVPSIQKLTICEPRIPYERVMPMGLDYAKRLPENFTLECLQHLETLPPGRAAMSRRHMASLAALLRHAPALTHLRVGRCDRSTDSVIEHPLPQLRELRVVDASLEVLKGVVRCCPGLQRVQLVEDTIDLSPMAAKFQAYHESLNPDKVAPGPLERALTSLLPLKATLRDVGIDWESFRTVKIQSLHPLSQFEALQSLRVCFSTWPSKDPGILAASLPSGIQSLYVAGKGIPVHDIALPLSERVLNGQLPEFKSFSYALIPQFRAEALGREVEEKVELLFKGTGVDCAEVKHRPL